MNLAYPLLALALMTVIVSPAGAEPAGRTQTTHYVLSSDNGAVCTDSFVLAGIGCATGNVEAGETRVRVTIQDDVSSTTRAVLVVENWQAIELREYTFCDSIEVEGLAALDIIRVYPLSEGDDTCASTPTHGTVTMTMS